MIASYATVIDGAYRDAGLSVPQHR
jgi:hypothetical protein